MTTAGDPAPTTIEPRTPTPYFGIGACALGAAAILTLILAVIIGGDPHAPVTPTVIALALGVVLAWDTGLWGMQQHRYAQRIRVTSAAAEARYTTWLVTQEQCEIWHAQQYQVISDQVQRREERGTQQYQTLLEEIQQLRAIIALMEMDTQRPQPQRQQPRLGSSNQSRQGRTRKKALPATPPAQPLPDNVTRLPSPRTVEALKTIAARIVDPDQPH